MNYVNIKGERINLDQVSRFYRHNDAVIFIFPVFNEDEDEEIDHWIKFDSPAAAAHCINFLDNKTECETFMLP